jgi:hypothetical protein
LNSIYNKYPASTCSVQGNNDNQNTRSETDLLNRLEKAFNKVTIQTKETKETCKKLEIQTVGQEKNFIIPRILIVDRIQKVCFLLNEFLCF